MTRAAYLRFSDVYDRELAVARALDWPARRVAGRRHATVMDRITRGFSPEELDAIAAWFAGSQR